MDTSRIEQFLGLAPKLGNPGENTPNPKSGFADLLLGVMSKRLSTVQPLPPAAKVASLMPTAPFTPAANISSDRVLSPAPGTHKPEIGKPASAPTQADEAASPQPQPTNDTDEVGRKVQSAVTPSRDPAEDAVEATLESADLGASAEQVETPEEGSDAGELPTDDETEEGAADDSGGEPTGGTDESSGETVPQQADTMTVPAAAIPPALASLATGTNAEDPTEEMESGTTPDTAKAVGTSSTATPSEDSALDATDTPIAEPATDAPTETADGRGDVAPGNDDAGPAALAATAGAALAAASDPQSSETQAKASAAAAQGERRAEDAAAMFRRNQSAPRQRAAAAGEGTTGTAPQAAAATTGLPSGAPAALAGSPTTTLSPIVPLGFDTGFGAGAGLPGWDLHFGQGAALRRPEFLANLRQHLQNLPLHEQVALSVKRAANDGGGRITLQLSPAELGRIHVKLDIDEEKNVRASVAVERPSTLELLQRDLRALERALQDAGLKTNQHELSLSLQGGDPEAFARQFGAEGDERGLAGDTEGDADTDADMAKAAGIVATGDGLVDVQI